jgi:hypothetical protein
MDIAENRSATSASREAATMSTISSVNAAATMTWSMAKATSVSASPTTTRQNGERPRLATIGCSVCS